MSEREPRWAAVITAEGEYNGSPAFEYEIRDADGHVLAVDFVHGAVDAEFVKSFFLPGRLVEWAMTDAKNTRSLSEAKSNQRLATYRSAKNMRETVHEPVLLTRAEAERMKSDESERQGRAN